MAEGTPLLTTLPDQAGCASGQVDYVEFSLQLIALNLPDELSIGGQRICRDCAVKPPLYDAIVRKLEEAMRGGIPVQACYDRDGNIFRLRLQR